MKLTEYWVYENYPNNKARAHARACSFFKVPGGDAPGTGKWHGPFRNPAEASRAGKATGRPFR